MAALTALEQEAAAMGLDELVVDVVDALVVRGASWLEPAAVDLDVARLSDLSSFAASERARAAGPSTDVAEAPSDWWRGLDDLEVAGPAGHRLAWRAGALHLVDHPDPESDRAMAALGGDRCPCLDVLDAWTASHRTERMLVVGARRLDEALAPPDDAIAALAADLARWRGAVSMLRADARAARDAATLERLDGLAAPQEAQAQERLGALRLLSIDARLQIRLQGSVAAALATRGPSAALSVAAQSRAVPYLRAIGWSASPGELDELLGPAWVASVWARGLAGAAPGRVVVDVTDVTPSGEFVVVAAAPGKAQVEMRVARVGQ
jgi:hypothetical protein